MAGPLHAGSTDANTDGAPAPAEDVGRAARGDGRPTSRPWRNNGGPRGEGPRAGPREGGHDGPRDAGGQNGGPNIAPNGGGPGPMREQVAPTPDEWEDIQKFMSQNSPVRLELFRKVEAERGADSNLANRLRGRVAGRYRDLQQMQERDGDLYQFALKQMQIEDDVLGTLLAMRSDGDSAELKKKLDEQMHGFVDNFLQQRAVKLKALKELVAKEETSLARDQANVEPIVGRQAERFRKEMDRMLDWVDRSGGREPTTAPAK